MGGGPAADYLAEAVTALGAEPLFDPHFAARDGDHYRELATALHGHLRDRVR